ncbi:MAG: hypothetical protein AAF291_05965 [Pseudomonadota bacterium]
MGGASKAGFATLGLPLAALACGLAISAAPALAQERIPIDLGPAPEATKGEPPEVVDILAPPSTPGAPTAAQTLECDEEAEAGEISGEIVVCRKKVDTSDRFAGSYSAWLLDYAERSKNYNMPGTPDVAGGGIFRGEPSVSGMCFIPPCPKPPAVLIDVEALPPPPVGSDAYWQSKGFSARPGEGELTPEARRLLEEELALPPKPDFSDEAKP